MAIKIVDFKLNHGAIAIGIDSSQYACKNQYCFIDNPNSYYGWHSHGVLYLYNMRKINQPIFGTGDIIEMEFKVLFCQVRKIRIIEYKPNDYPLFHGD